MRTDFLVVGGGIIGLSVAAALRRRFGVEVLLVEKEPQLGLHASGRNSGILHAGFYYSDDSLKARFSREGNRRLTEYCLERGLPIRQCGKLVVARSEQDLEQFAELERRAAVNGVQLRSVTPSEMRDIEPRARTVGRALFSPTTASVDPRAVVASLARDAELGGVRIRTDTRYLSRTGEITMTTRGPVTAGYVVNAAGLYADAIAHDFGFGRRYRILPFKGLYLYASEGETLRTNVYPVPDLRNPFAGVHFTLTVDGAVKLGPTAGPAFWREQYAGTRGFRIRETVQILAREAGLLLHNDFGFRSLALAEIRKYRRSRMVQLGGELVAGVTPSRYRRWGPPGIRAQLFDVRDRRLVMDFVMEGDNRSFHVLNAVSPAFTCALPFADYVVERIERLTA